MIFIELFLFIALLIAVLIFWTKKTMPSSQNCYASKDDDFMAQSNMDGLDLSGATHNGIDTTALSDD